MIFSWLE